MDHAFSFNSTGGYLGLPVIASSDTKKFLEEKISTTIFAVAGITWDGCVTNRPGARFGPNAIRQASQMLCSDEHPFFDVTPVEYMADLGNLLLPNTNLDRMRSELFLQARELIGQYEMVWLGGDHSITLPLLRAYYAHYKQPLACIHFDAHCDTWENHFGEPSGHGTWVHEAITEGLVDPKCFVQIGIRSSGAKVAREFINDRGGLVYTARDLRGKDGDALKGVIDEVRARMERSGNPPLYLTIDIDALDPAFAPGTGTPEVGGLTTSQAMTFLEAWCDLNWIGMDCTEVSPPYDYAELTSNAASTLIWTWLCGRVIAKKLKRG